jgi:hypothetical protein
MSYLNKANGLPNFSKAVISLWFRIPKASLDAITPGRDDERLSGVLPLMTFGKQFQGYGLETVAGATASYTEQAWYTPGDSWQPLGQPKHHSYSTGSIWKQGEAHPVNPSFVGVRKGSDNTFTLTVFLRTESYGTAVNVSHLTRQNISNLNWGYSTASPLALNLEAHADGNICRTGNVTPGNPWSRTVTIEDTSDYVLRKDGPDSFEAGFALPVKPDTWHHVLISFDLNHSTKATGAYAFYDYGVCAADGPTPPVQGTFTDRTCSDPSRIWIALDDKNYNGPDLTGAVALMTGIRDANLLFGPNEIVSRNSLAALRASGGGQKSDGWGVSGSVEKSDINSGPAPTYTLTGVTLPSKDYVFGIPAAADLVDGIRKAEMAELQMWTGVILDTSLEQNRRAFIDFERDENGNIVRDDTGKAIMKPAPPEAAQKLLGRRPEILLHGNSNWSAGKNTGSLGTDASGNEIAAGQFKPTGAIISYTPDPSLAKAV